MPRLETTYPWKRWSTIMDDLLADDKYTEVIQAYHEKQEETKSPMRDEALAYNDNNQ